MKNLRVALLSPRAVAAKKMIRRVQPPLGLISLAAILRSSGYREILVIDSLIEDYDNVESLDSDGSMISYGASNEKIIRRLTEFSPDIIGISSLFSSQVSQAYSLASAVKNEFPDVPLIFGGIHASDKAEDVLIQNSDIDYVLAGEGDYSFLNFVESYSTNKELQSIDGLIRREDNKIIKNSRPDFIKDLDSLPFPAWDLLPMEEYFNISMYHNPFVKSGRVGCIMTSRGCPDKCYFCASTIFFGHSFRAMSPSRVADMVDYLVDTFDIKELQIEDDNFTVNYKRVIEICEKIKKHKLRITMPNAMRADAPIDHDKRLLMFKAMKEAGWEQIGLGVEHGNQKFLDDVIGKRLKLDEVIATCELAHEAGLLVHANFMIGFPNESEAQRDDTVKFAKELDADSFSLSLATPLPGTAMWDIIEESDLFLDSYELDKGLPTLVSIKPEGISVGELQELVTKVNVELNETAAMKRKETMEKYNLFKNKSSFSDRKYLDPSSSQVFIDK